MDLKLKVKILERYRSQADFAKVVNMREPEVSRVIHGRMKLSKDRRREWSRALACRQEDIFTTD